MSASRRLQVDTKRALIPVSLVVFGVLYWFGAPVWLLGVLMLWIPLFYIGIPLYLRNRWNRFEKEFARRFPLRDYTGLLAYYERQWFLRLFAPRAQMLGKLGLIYAAMGKARDAERVLEAAVRGADRHSRERIMLNLGHVKYELGKYDQAEQIYLRLLDKTPHLSGAKTKLAVIWAHTRKQKPELIPTLEAALKSCQDEDERRRLQEALDLAHNDTANGS